MNKLFIQKAQSDQQILSKNQQANLNSLEKIWNRLKSFNQKQLSEENLRVSLIRLVIFLNKGWQFDNQEKEDLFFQLTNSLFCKNPNVRRLIYTILNMLNLKQYMYMIVQSLINDLESNNQYIRQSSLQYIPLLDDEDQIMKVEKFIRNALLGKNYLIQSQAMLVGLKILKKIPNQVRNEYCLIIMNDLSENQFFNQLHALNLLHELKKDDPDTLKLTPLVKQQVIKYIKEILALNDEKLRIQNLELEQYLLSQLYYSDPLIFFEASKAVISILPDQQLQPMMKFLMNYLDKFAINIHAYTALKIFELLIQNSERKNLIQPHYLEQIEDLIFSENISVSSQALNLCIYLERLNPNLPSYLQKIYQSNEDKKLNFLQGMLGLAPNFHQCGDDIIQFQQLVLPQYCSYQMADLAFLITEQIYLREAFCFQRSIENLLWIARSLSSEHKMRAILLFQEKCFSFSFNPISPNLSTVQKDFKRLLKRLKFKKILKKLCLKYLIIEQSEKK